MVRMTHPILNFGGTGFQPVHRTGKMPVPPKTFWNRMLVKRRLKIHKFANALFAEKITSPSP
jgi:hypothetical protein